MLLMNKKFPPPIELEICSPSLMLLPSPISCHKTLYNCCDNATSLATVHFGNSYLVLSMALLPASESCAVKLHRLGRDFSA